MPDPLRLVAPIPVESRRRPSVPPGRGPVDRPSHGREITDSLDAVDLNIGDPNLDEDITVVLKLHGATRLPTGPLSGLGFEHLGETADWTYFVLSSAEARQALRDLVGEYEADVAWDHPKTWATLLDNVEGVSLYGREDRRDPELRVDQPGQQTVDVMLWPATTAAGASRRLGVLRAAVTAATATGRAARIVAEDPRPETLSARLEVDPAVLDDLLDMPVVERVRPPLRAAVTVADIVRAGVPNDLPSMDGPPIGIVDDLIVTANPLLQHVVIDQAEFPAGHGFGTPTAHGTQVGGVAAFGSLEPLLTGGTPDTASPIVVARVLDDLPSGPEMVGQPHVTFESAVRWLVATHNVRIVNCSIAYGTPANSGLPDPFTVAVDTLARELGIVIVLATGNRLSLSGGRDWLGDYPAYLADAEAKVAAPGDAALAVTVGAVAKRDVPAGAGAGGGSSRTAIAQAQQASPFTRTGPTRGTTAWGTNKPEFVHHGGNWAWDHSTRTVAMRDAGISVVLAIPPVTGRVLGIDNGTSFAAPAVANELARLVRRYPDAGSNLLRALLALSARHPGGYAQPRAATDTLVSAYGVPDSTRVADSGGNRALLVYEGTIETGRAYVHRLPIPDEFVGRDRYRTLRAALAFDPPVRRARREYVAGRMTMSLVYGMSLEEVQSRYRLQPSQAEVEADPSLRRFDLPDVDHRPDMEPGSRRLLESTLLRRDFLGGNWQERHLDCFLVITHDHTKSTARQKAEYPTQDYALAVELVDETKVELDLHAAVQARLRPRLRARGT